MFPVGWDWRRDFFEQSKRVYNTVLFAKNETGCNPIVVGHSFGGVVAYTAFTRYGKDFSDNVHAMLYSVSPFSPLAGGAGGTYVSCSRSTFIPCTLDLHREGSSHMDTF